MIIGILGSSGFVGANMVHFLSDKMKVLEISLREEGWRDKIATTDILINLIGKAHDHDEVASESEYENVNVGLVKELYRVFANSKNKALIHFSSIAAVEEFDRKEVLTEDERCTPISWYAVSKKKAEQWLEIQQKKDDKKVIILRPPMIHGKGDKGNLTLLYKLISKGIPYPLAAYENSRSFIAMPNLLFFVWQIILKYEILESGIYHVADDECLSTREVIDVIKEISGKKSINIVIPKMVVRTLAKFGDVIKLPLNTKRLKKMTGNMIVSNAKIKSALEIDKLPFTAKDGLILTIRSFSN